LPVIAVLLHLLQCRRQIALIFLGLVQFRHQGLDLFLKRSIIDFVLIEFANHVAVAGFRAAGDAQLAFEAFHLGGFPNGMRRSDWLLESGFEGPD
jgi:hypothetical protein